MFQCDQLIPGVKHQTFMLHSGKKKAQTKNRRMAELLLLLFMLLFIFTYLFTNKQHHHFLFYSEVTLAPPFFTSSGFRPNGVYFVSDSSGDCDFWRIRIMSLCVWVLTGKSTGHKHHPSALRNYKSFFLNDTWDTNQMWTSFEISVLNTYPEEFPAK